MRQLYETTLQSLLLDIYFPNLTHGLVKVNPFFTKQRHIQVIVTPEQREFWKQYFCYALALAIDRELYAIVNTASTAKNSSIAA